MNEFDYLAKAKKNFEKERYHEVISLCDKALKINKDLPEAYSFRGNARYELGEYKTAAEDFSQAIKREPNDAEHYFHRSWSYWNIDNFDDAIVDISKALDISKNSRFYYSKGCFEYWAKRYKDGIVNLTKGIELKPTEAKYVARGDCYLELEMFNEALADFNSAIVYNPEYERAYYRRGVLYKQLDRLEDAEKDFKKVLELNPKDDFAMRQIGFIRIQLGKKDAMKYFNKAIKVNPCADSYYWKVIARQKIFMREDSLKKLSEGKLAQYDDDEIFNDKQAQDDIKDLNKALALDSEDIYCLRLRGSRYLYLKQYENALADCENLFELEPEKYNWQRSIAYCKYCINDFKGCIDEIDKYLEMNDGDADDFQARGYANYELKNYKAAINDFAKALVLNEDAGYYYYLGLTYYKLKHLKLSYQNFKKALEINPQVEEDKDYKIPFLIKMFLGKKKNNDTPTGLSQITTRN